MRTTRSTAQLDRLLGCLVGGGVGVFVTVCLGIAVLLLLGSAPKARVTAPPETYDIEAVVSEDYINRSMRENTAALPLPVPMVASHLDVRPGGLGDFTVKVKIGPLEPVFQGTVAMGATSAGQIEVRIVQIRVGYLPVTPLVPASMLGDLNRAVNEMMAQRAGPLNLRMAGVASDEDSFRFYLTIQP